MTVGVQPALRGGGVGGVVGLTGGRKGMPIGWGGGAAALSQVWVECFGVVGVKKTTFVYKSDKALPL